MRRLPMLLLAAGAIASGGCATRQGKSFRDVTAPPPPAIVPQTWDFSDPAVLAQHERAVDEACQWLLDVAPATAEPKGWVRTRDFALDWIEASKEPEIPILRPVVAYAVGDHHFFYGVYMTGAYQCGKARWVLRARAAGIDPSDWYTPEEAAVVGMIRLYHAFRRWDEGTRSRKIERMMRKLRHGKLQRFLQKKIMRATPKR